MPNLSYVCYKHIVPRGMAVKPGSWVHHIVILWMSNGRKQFAGLLVCPGRRGTSCFLVWQVLRIFFRNKNVGLPDYLMLCLQATTLRFAFLPPGRLFLPLEYLVVTGYTLQTSTSVVDSAKACWSLLGAGPSPMKLPRWKRFMNWCVPGMDWRQLTFLNLRISHWYLSS